MKNFIARLAFFIGWLLSPLTFWNDAFINMPVSYIAATVLFRFIRIDFAALVVICYWLSNAAGLLLMFISGKSVLKKGIGLARQIFSLAATIACYTAILFILAKAGIIKPL